MCAMIGNNSMMARTIRGRELFEGANYSRARTTRGRELFQGRGHRCENYSRASAIRGRELFCLLGYFKHKHCWLGGGGLIKLRMCTWSPQQENLLWQGLNVFSSRPVAIFAFPPPGFCLILGLCWATTIFFCSNLE